MKQASVRLATALAQSVFPVPGGPKRRTPFGGSIPSLTKRSGYFERNELSENQWFGSPLYHQIDDWKVRRIKGEVE